jgi:uncharacterized membrane protein
LASIMTAVALGRTFVIAAVGWAVALPLASFAVVQTSSTHWCYAFAFALYAIGSLVCHQLPARSFHLASVPLPVCARCVGIYAGAAIGAVSRVRWPVAYWRRALVVAALPTAATIGYEWTTFEVPANWIRALAGLPLGAVISLIVLSACWASATAYRASK